MARPIGGSSASGRGGGRRSRGRGGGRGRHQQRQHTQRGEIGGGCHPREPTNSTTTTRNATTTGEPPQRARKLLVLHGNRQTGDLLLGRMSSLKRKLGRDRGDGRPVVEMVAPDAPFLWEDGDGNSGDGPKNGGGGEALRTWWHRDGNQYVGLEISLDVIRQVWSGEGGDDDDGGRTDAAAAAASSPSSNSSFDGIIGFSQGARLAHLIAMLHSSSHGMLFPGLRYVILVSAYGSIPLPTNFPPRGSPWDEGLSSTMSGAGATASSRSIGDDGDENESGDGKKIGIPSLHVMGLADKLIPVECSRARLDSYVDPMVHEHPGGHHVPMKAADVETYLKFIGWMCYTDRLREDCSDVVGESSKSVGGGGVGQGGGKAKAKAKSSAKNEPTTKQQPQPAPREPDEDHAQAQADECESLSLIFPDEFKLLSRTINNGGDGTTTADNDDDVDDDDEYGTETNNKRYVHPISYTVKLRPPPDQMTDETLWPVDADLSLRVTYPPDYPDVMPTLTLDHNMNMVQFKSGQSRACLGAVREAAESEIGMPSVMSCVYAAREFFENGGMASAAAASAYTSASASADSNRVGGCVDRGEDEGEGVDADGNNEGTGGLLARASPDRIADCNRQGLEIASSVLGHPHSEEELSACVQADAADDGGTSSSNGGGTGKGGSWKYTIGLVGKPSAGKSTFFNAATAFARQRGGGDGGTDSAGGGVAIGGATMAPHPFTTIDPNVGYCLVPAPPGSCPEGEDDTGGRLVVGSTHGRDSRGRRLLPVMLKDVAGLVPGAYQGRGKGNKFLDDLTDADVLIHVVDISGTADTEGNAIGYSEDDGGDDADKTKGAGSHPLNDLAWVRNELLEWVYSNLACKWDSIVRRGRNKLVTMFSGYRQNQAFVWDVLLQVEAYLDESEGRDHALDHLDLWDEADLYRLVSAFLGVRFPMALALNKSDLPSAAPYVKDVREALPIHGAHVGIPLCARSEMGFVRYNITNPNAKMEVYSQSVPEGVWECLQSAVRLREPVLVFPVHDMTTYEPLPGMTDYATGHSSLPNVGMVACLQSAGGEPPSLWDAERQIYVPLADDQKQKQALRDVVAMKPGSKVEDVFLALKNMGAIGGEFVRAEGAGRIGEKPKLVKKDDRLCKNNRILKIMTNKRQEWQKKGGV